MANVFDQFDAQSQPGAASNPFDQFDPPANVFDQFDGGPGFATPFKAAARGLGAGTGAAIAGFGTATNAQDRKTLALFDAIDAGQKLGGPDLLNLQASVYAKAPPAVRKQMRDQAAGISGAATDLQTAGADITQATQSAIPLTPGEQDSLVSKVPEMVTYAAPAVVGMMATKGAGAGPMLGTGATIMGAQGADQGFQDALAHGASLDDAYKAATTSAAIQGGLGALPVGLVLDRINAATGNMFTRALTGAVTQGGTQSLIGMVQQALTNLEAKGLYDPQRGLADGVTDAAILGGLGGGLTGGTLGALPKGAPREAVLPPATDTGATPAVPAGALPDHLMPSAGDVVGLNTRGGTPQRVTIDSVNGGHVFFTDEAGVKRGTTAADFSRDLTAAPEPKIDTNIISAAQPDRVLVRGDPIAPAASAEAEAAPRPFDDDLFGLPGSEEAKAVIPKAEAVETSAVEPKPLSDIPGRENGLPVDRGPEPVQPERPAEVLPRTAAAEAPVPRIQAGDIAIPEEIAGEPSLTPLARVVEPPKGTGTAESPIIAKTAADIDQAAAQVAKPTDAQKESGNYQKGHVNVQGLNIAIETPKGAERSGVAPNGEPWSVEMPAHYGYVKRTVGGDGESVDVYLGDNPESKTVAVVDQIDPETGKYDEHKAFIGFDNPDQVLSTYDAAFSDHSGPRRRGGAVAMSMDQFKDWLKSGNTKKPINDQNVGVDIDVRASSLQPQNISEGMSGGTGEQQGVLGGVADSQGRATESVAPAGVDNVLRQVPASASDTGPAGGRRSFRDTVKDFIADESGVLGREDEPLIDTIRAPDGRPATAAEIAVEASRLARMPRDSTLGKLRKTFSYVTLPVALASKDRLSANLFGAVMDRFRRLNALENEAVPQASPYFRLKRPAMDRVNQVMEAARLYGLDLPDDGRSIVLQVPEERTPYGSPRPELSKPGQVLALSPEETAAYHRLKGFFQNRLTQMGEALARSRGYDGDFTREAIQAQMDAATAAGRRVPKSLSRAMQAFEMTEEMQRAGYVPFNRYGDYFVRVRPIDPASGDQGGLWFVPKQSVFQDIQVKMDGSNEQIPVKEKVTELRRQYPADRFHIETGKTETLGGKNVLMTANIPQLEKIFMMLDRPGTDASAAILDDLMDKLFEARKAGFRKQAQNVRGYSTDFERSIADYIRQSSAHVSNMEHRNTIDAAKAQMDEHPSKDIRTFWDGYMRELDTPDSAFSQAARKVGFFQFIWGSFASAATNLLQTPTITFPQMQAWAGPRTVTLVGDALLEGAMAVRPGVRGLYIDWSKVGRTDAEKQMIANLRREGVLDPRMSEEAQGRNVTSSQRLRPYHKRMGHVWDAGASMFSAAESVNRIAAALAHFRAAFNPHLVEQMARVYSKDQNFQRMRYAGGLTPENIARFGIEDTQFIGGKVNRAPITRGPGAWLLQFKPYMLNYLRIFSRQMTSMGWRGKMALALGVGALGAQSGMYGAIPGTQDAIDLAEWIYKQFTGIDPMIEARIKQAASDSAMGPLGGELVGHGLGRLGPVDISNRTSMGQIVPSGNPMDLFPLASGTVGRGMQFWNEMSQGRPWTAWAGASGLVLGKGGEDIAKAVALSKEGYATQKGNVVEFPSQVTNSQLAARGLGFQPSDLSKELEQRTEANRMKESTTAASSKLLTDVSRELALAQDATRSGDKATADKHYARYLALIKANAAQLADPSIPMWQKVPPIQARAIKAAVKQQIDYENSVLSRTSKLKRGAVQSIQNAP